MSESTIGKCLVCGEKTKPSTKRVKGDVSSHFRKYCSPACYHKDPAAKARRAKTVQDRYGVSNVSKSKSTQDKRTKTFLKNYGVDNPAKAESVKQKTIDTCMEKYGVSSTALVPAIRKKQKDSLIKNHGVSSPLQSPEIKQKVKDTCIERYGVVNPMQSKKVKEKSIETTLNKYGVTSTNKLESVKQKKINTSITNYGTESPLQSEIVKNKIKQTCMERYGVEHSSQSEKSKASFKQTIFDRLLNSDRLKGKVKPMFNIDAYEGIEDRYEWECISCATVFIDHIDDGRVPRCPICYPKYKSKPEIEILEFIKQYYPDAVSGERKLIHPYEIDIFIPELALGIEFNGLYWHSELNGGKDAKYHIQKTFMCANKDVQLIHVFEDEWRDKNDIIKSILLNKMGKSCVKVFARKCNIKIVDNKVAKQFLFDNHLQGSINGTHIGLFFENSLVSMLTMGKSRYATKWEYEILRFCNIKNTSVVGGLSKLLSYFKANYNPKSIMTYADGRFGIGNGYRQIGFISMDKTKPNYFYLRKSGDYYIRQSRHRYQKHKLAKLLDTFDPSLTEWENMQLAGYDRIWDCGNYRYVWSA